MVNKVILVGRLGKDPEIHYTPDGTMATNFTIATSEQWKDKNGEKVQRTEWHQIVTYRKLAEICGNYLAKGKLVFIEGRIQNRSWEDKQGNKHYTTEIIADNMKMLDGGRMPSDSKGHSSSGGNTEDIHTTEGGQMPIAQPPEPQGGECPPDDVPF